MLQFKEIKKLLKKDLTCLLSVKMSYVSDAAIQFLATAINLYEFDADFIIVFQAPHKQSWL